MMSVIEHFETAFDWSEAEKSGRIVPREGVDEAFDAATATVTEVEGKLTAYLEEQRKHFGNSSEVNSIKSDICYLPLLSIELPNTFYVLTFKCSPVVSIFGRFIYA